MKKILRLEFIDSSPDVALLVFRVWLGASMFWLHGWPKVLRMFSGEFKFADPLGIGGAPTLVLATFAEAVCPVFVVLGLWTRFASVFTIATMAVAFFLHHGGKLSGQGNGELAFVYLAGFSALFIAGAGRFSLDKR